MISCGYAAEFLNNIPYTCTITIYVRMQAFLCTELGKEKKAIEASLVGLAPSTTCLPSTVTAHKELEQEIIPPRCALTTALKKRRNGNLSALSPRN